MSEPLELRVVSGSPDDAELAAVVAVLLAAGRPAPAPPDGGRRSLWGDPATLVRQGAPLPPGRLGGAPALSDPAAGGVAGRCAPAGAARLPR